MQVTGTKDPVRKITLQNSMGIMKDPGTNFTEQLVRKRAEHNNLEISSLEEVSLHQQDIERIEHLDKWCRELKILYLQSNLIPKIENVAKLKKLEYLNLALNNVERIENLENCESLKKLDLTVNFIGELTSIENLKGLVHLTELYLTGNPCTEYDGYRKYVVATLPQLQYLDGTQVEKSERILAQQDLGVIKGYIIEQQNRHRKKRTTCDILAQEKEKEQIKQHEEKKNKKNQSESTNKDGTWYTNINNSVEGGEQNNEAESECKNCEQERIAENGDTNQGQVTVEDVEENEEDDEMTEEKDKEFWEEKVPFTPESRVAVHEHMKKVKEKEDKKNQPKPKPPRQMFSEDGRPLNVNEAKVDFSLADDEENNALVLDVACFKHMDTSLIDCDVQPNYVRVTLKGKVFQLHLGEDVNPDSSTAKRSQITGNLLVTMPKAKQVIKPKKIENKKVQNKENVEKQKRPKEERLEVDESARKTVDLGNIVSEKTADIVPPLGHRNNKFQVKERENSADFIDDPDVPPLE
ncbi:hypothetical protein FSP39_009461 [Pinctada imbricata]|uniref:Dynein axonemal assembly factor 11-like CS domain-containing protein n=1 Tax=Pinctada imbricata TaxID=66713 RepID=A0AA88XQU1_PINIB|nr:hypothetical protein FSP39_009461 [Pinctada imbricata]